MQTVKVRVRKPTRVLTFLANDIAMTRMDRCVVRSDRGLEFGVCIVPPETCPPDQEKRYKMHVVRKATEQDEATYYRIKEEEQSAAVVCKRKIADRKLPMKLVDTEYTFDKGKIVFHFTAADRVDFRELVRELAHDLKTRIELRHIQVRDEARIVGSIGVCGRELCCSTWLQEFQPISMKMAKRQNLSLNPSKISGQCGRLLCCLSYENDLYQNRKLRDSREAADAAKDAAAAAGVPPMPAERTAAPVEERKDRPAESRPPRPRRRPTAADAKEARGDAAPAQDRTEGEAGPSKPRRRRRRRLRGGGGGSGSSAAPKSE